MNFETVSSDNNHVLTTDNHSWSHNTEATGYDLDLTEGEFSHQPQLSSASSENLDIELETVSLEPDDSQQLVFIDSSVKDIETLTDNISGAEVIVLNSDQDELLQISEHLSNYQDLDAVHIVSHGEPGQLSFGNTELNQETLPEYVNLLGNWNNSLTADAD